MSKRTLGPYAALAVVLQIVLLAPVAQAARGDVVEFVARPRGSGSVSIAAAPDGTAWFLESSANRVARITPHGRIETFAVPTPASGLSSITVGPHGNLWFTESAANKIGRITPLGSITEFPIPTAASYPTSITAGPDGNLWFTEYDAIKIGRITPSGAVTEFSVDLHPRDIASGPGGLIWFTEGTDLGGDVAAIDTAGGAVCSAFTGFDSRPWFIAAGPDGNVWVTDDESYSVYRVTPSCQLSSYYGGYLPESITAGPDGNLWLASQSPDGKPKIIRMSPSGQLLGGIGIRGASLYINLVKLASAAGRVWFTADRYHSLTDLVGYVSAK